MSKVGRLADGLAQAVVDSLVSNGVERRLAARVLELEAAVVSAVAVLDAIEDRAPHDIDGMIYTIPWAEGVVRGSKMVRSVLVAGVPEPHVSEEGTR